MANIDKHLVKGDLPGQLSFFRSHYDRCRIFAPPGDRLRDEFELRIADDGTEYLEKVGTVDQYEEIQSHALSVDINYLIARYSAGDFNALNRRQAVYGDFTTCPKTFADMLNQVRDAQSVFDQMPVEVKNRFGNSFERWLSTYGTKEWSVCMGINSDVKSASAVESSSEGGDSE